MHVTQSLMKSARQKPVTGRETDAYLRRLGERVRTLRNQRGMTRKALARHAKVSERYLAQLGGWPWQWLYRPIAADLAGHRPPCDTTVA